MAGDAPSLLVLGDGNFSFSLYLLQRGAAGRTRPAITATSFDSHEDVLRKYPEARGTLEKLAAGGVALHHDVDATQLSTSAVRGRVYDSVVFNFPHLGVEDAGMHKRFMAHLFDSASYVLGVGGTFHVALASGQRERWDLLRTASRLGFACFASTAISPRDLDGYEWRRHQSGRSFQRRTEGGATFSFHRRGERWQHGPWWLSAAAAPAGGGLGRKRPRAEGERSGRGAASGEHACPRCAKTFRTAQGVRTHLRNVHEIPEEKGRAGGAEDGRRQWECRACRRTFSDADALEQHRLAKHVGRHTEIKPDWFRGGAAAQAPQDRRFACRTCAAPFGDWGALQRHLREAFRPSEPRAFACACGRTFRERRALLQHQNRCATADAADRPRVVT